MATITGKKNKRGGIEKAGLNKKQNTTSPTTTDPYSSENLDKIGAARGNEFAPAFEAAGGVQNGESITATLDRRAGQSGGKGATAQAAKLASEQKRIATLQAKGRKDTRTKIGNTSYADKLRASNKDTTKEESITEKGSRSTPSVAKPLGTGTPLTDQEILELEAQGFTEGDMVPGRGILLPDGTFNATSVTANNLRSKETTTAQGAVATDTPIVREEENAKKKVEDASITSPSKAALDLLDEELGRIKDDLRSREANIKSTYSSAKGQLEGKQASETGATSVGLAEAGGYLGFSGGAQGVMLSLAQSHRTELADLDAKRQNAIQEARDAAADKRYDVVRLKAAEVARIDQETYERQEAYNAEVKKVADKETAKQEKLQVQKDINDVIQYGRSTGNLHMTVDDIFNELGGTVDIEEINKFLKSMAGSGKGAFDPTPTQITTMLGAGMNSDDIATFTEYVSENGYTDELRNSLTPMQRTAVDKIMRPKAADSNNSTDVVGPAVSFDEYIALAEEEMMMSIDPNSDLYTELENTWKQKYPTQSNIKFTKDQQLKLEQAGLLGASRQDQLDHLYAPKEDDLTIKEEDFK